MGRKYQIISGDGHVETPPESWVKYMPEIYQDRAPRLVKLATGGEAWLIEGQPLIPNGQNITGRGPVVTEGGSYFNEDGSSAEGAGDAAQRLREQDIDGIDAEVLFPPIFASRAIENIGDKDVYRALIRAYNTFLAKDYCAVAPDRLIGNGVVPTTGIEDAIAEIEFLVDNGIRSVSLHMFPNGSGFAKPEDDEFWKRSLEIGMKLSPHFGFGQFAPDMSSVGVGTGPDPFAGTIVQRVSGQPPMYNMSQIICSGALDRFPDLQFYFAEVNASWLPWGLFVIDDNYEIFKGTFDRKLERKPSEYILDHFWFGIIRDPKCVAMRDHLPFDRLMFGSDFPHSVGSYPKSKQFLDDAFDGVPDSYRNQMLLENPAKYFDLDLDADITPTPEA
ncbi:MAG: amidohydrolase [Longimicrobiales bacterium]|nr:amidohydrolase [Longimicrobiales bacterium]